MFGGKNISRVKRLLTHLPQVKLQLSKFLPSIHKAVNTSYQLTDYTFQV